MGGVSPKKVGDYASVGNFNITTTAVHNFDPGRNGIIADVSKSTPSQSGPIPSDTGTQSVAIEIDGNTGKVLELWDLASIISYAMQAGGASEAEISSFVQPGKDWFHMNSTVYNPVDNTLIVSSRENFVIDVDYDVPTDNQVRKIHWILGDPTKAWYTHPSLRKFALALLPDEQLPPIGQHALSIDSKNNLLLFNDGEKSQYQSPSGIQLSASIGESFAINTSNMTATREFVYNRNPTVFNPYCGSIYEDAFTGNYLVNYPDPTSPDGTIGNGIIQGIDSLSSVIFEVQFSQPNPNPQKIGCAGGGWNAFPLNLLNLTFAQ